MAQASDIIDAHEIKINQMYPAYTAAEKTWTFVKRGTIPLLVLLASNINPDSWLGQILAAIMGAIHG